MCPVCRMSSLYKCVLSEVQPIPLGVSFSKAQSSKPERLFCHVSVKRDVQALSFELWNSIRKCHPNCDWLYMYFHMYMYVCIMYIHIPALRSSRERHEGMYFCIHTYVYVSMYICVYIYMYYVYTYIFMYIHRYTMCIHIPVPWPPRGRHHGVNIFSYTHIHASMHGLSPTCSDISQSSEPKLAGFFSLKSSQVSFHWKVATETYEF